MPQLGLIALLVSELVYLTIRFDTQALDRASSPWLHLVAWSPQYLRLAIAAAIALLALRSSRLGVSSSPRSPAASASSRIAWLAVHLGALALFIQISAVVFDPARSSPHAAGWVLAWFLSGLCALVAWGLALAPRRVRLPQSVQVRRLMGLDPDAKVLTLDHFLQAVHPEDSGGVRAEFERCREQGGVFNVEFRVRWSDGSVHWLSDHGKVFHDDVGAPLFITGACVDVTVRKRNEEILREADQKKDQFLALLAHELRNPLAPLRNGLQVMRLAHDETTVADTRAMMERQLSHLIRLIDDLLDVSRLTENKLHLQRSRILLSDVIRNSIESARPAIQAAEHKLVVSLPAEPVYLDGDLTRLAQVFSNLLTNSAKYTERGGHIWVSAQLHGTQTEVSVRDDGIGIPPEAIDHIFDMFSQVDRSIERTTGGLGIGLALVKGIVEMHGGKARAFSDGPGLGSTFTVTLPVSRQPTDWTDLPMERNVEPSNARRKTLVVDDNRDSADSMAAFLRLLGHEVQTANDGIEAVESAERFRPDIILMDIGMPRLNGYEATQRIRKQPWGQEIAIIALTGWGQDADRERSRAARCDAHLVKPVSLSDLSRLLNSMPTRGRREGSIPA